MDDKIPLPDLQGLFNPKVEREITSTFMRVIDYFTNKLRLQKEDFDNKLKETETKFEAILKDPTSLVNLFATPVIGSSSSDPLLQSLVDSFGTQAIHTVFAAPSGTSGNPTFRLLIASDLPAVIASQLDANGTTLDVNIINDGEVLKRVGTTIIGFLVPKNNLDVVAPTPIDDDTLGYSIFSLWQDTSAIRTYICQDASTGAAVWVRID